MRRTAVTLTMVAAAAAAVIGASGPASGGAAARQFSGHPGQTARVVPGLASSSRAPHRGVILADTTYQSTQGGNSNF
jgi:hypothetical protein